MQRDVIESKINGLRRERGVAALDGGKFDAAALTAAEAELEAIDDATAEQTRRDRAAAHDAHLEAQAEKRKALAAATAAYLGAVADAEKYTRATAQALGVAIGKAVEIRKLAHELSGEVPMPLHQNDIAQRLSGRLSAVMSTIPGQRNRFGYVEWLGAGLHQPTDDWQKAEAAIADRHINPLTKENDNG